MNHSFHVVVPLLLALLMTPFGACDRDPASPPKANPPTAAAPEARPADTLDVPALLKAGGTNWSSHDEIKSGARTLKSGQDYWIWPTDDVRYTPEPNPSGRGAVVVVPLNWRLRPGGKPITGGTVYATLQGDWPGAPRIDRRTPAEFPGAGAEGGVLRLHFEGWKATGDGDGDVTLSLSRPGDPAPLSNLLRLQIAARP